MNTRPVAVPDLLSAVCDRRLAREWQSRVDKGGQADRLMVLKGVLAELFDDEGGEK